jgi:hypothetical protein
MEHAEAVKEMAAERYLLDELDPEIREAFEAHVFECQDCALDLRAGAAFVGEAKVQLPAIMAPSRAFPAAARLAPKKKPRFTWWSPAFAAPAFAVLLGIIAYQNFSTIPALRSAAAEPQILPWASIHPGTRGTTPAPVIADRVHGAILMVDLPQQAAYASYSFELYDPQGNRVWKTRTTTPEQTESGTVSLQVPGRGLKPGTYSLAVFGVLPSGATTEIGRRAFDIRFPNG